MDGAHRISCERGSRAWSSFCVSRHFGRAAGGRGAVPLFSSQSNHQVPTPPRRRTRQGLDEDLHGACSARGSTTVCTAAPARWGRAAVGAGGGGEGGARGSCKHAPAEPEPPRAEDVGWLPRDAAADPPAEAAAAKHARTARCAGRAATCAASQIDARLGTPTTKTTAAAPALPLRADRARSRRRPRALTAAPPATTRITPHPPVPRARALTSPVNLRFADFSRTTQ